MNTIYQDIIKAKVNKEKLLAVLIDPDKTLVEAIPELVRTINQSIATHIFVGGSKVDQGMTQQLVKAIKKHSILPVVLFPGDESQITETADALLFLSLLSGRNPEYLIGQHIKSIPKLIKSTLEVISTSYILIDGGTTTSTQKVSKTTPLDKDAKEMITHTALSGQFMGHQLLYLEAGSGAKDPVAKSTIKEVCEAVSIPVIVGGGISNETQMETAYQAGAVMVVIGTAFEKTPSFFNQLKRPSSIKN